MRKSKSFNINPRLEKARRRFDGWRDGHRHGRRRIPAGLWRLAVKLAGEYGINQTARSLGLSYVALKERVAGTGLLAPEARLKFVEVNPAAAINLGGSLIELEGLNGAKMRIQLGGGEALDVVALTRSFCGAGA